MTEVSNNPFNALIEITGDDPIKIQARYEMHRVNRNKKQREILLDPNFNAFSPDLILSKLVNPTYDNFKDHRHCLVFWARPTQAVKELISQIQDSLKKHFPNLWYVPASNLHMTTAEITHSREQHEIESIISNINHSIENIVNFTYNHRVRLIKPVIGFDSSALALSFLPAAGEALSNGRTIQDDAYTFTHLRRDLCDKCVEAGAIMQSRYIIETSHITIARFINEVDFQHDNATGLNGQKVSKLVSIIEEINKWLEEQYWPHHIGRIRSGGEWIVGEAIGLDLRCGTPWYGEGDRVQVGKGF